jgi:hypothetical protein
MKKLLAGTLVAGLLVGALGLTAGAAKRRKPVATKLYLHGTTELGEIENGQYIAGSLTGGSNYMTMNAKAPRGGSSKSFQIINYGAGPNTVCAGNNLFPVWVGKLKGTVTGPVKVSFTTMSSPGEVDVRLFSDVLGTACNDDYPGATREARVPLATNGKVTAKLNGKDFKVKQVLMLQISPATTDVAGTPRPLPPFVGRVFYDSKESGSQLSFKCIPAGKAKSCAK